MFERYTERARRALFFARQEVTELGGRELETEHLLAGLVRDVRGFTRDVLERAQLFDHLLRAEIETRLAGRDRLSMAVEIPFSADTKRILQWAASEADRLGHKEIGSEHLLLGILCEPETGASQILTAHGITLAAVRDELARLPHGRH